MIFLSCSDAVVGKGNDSDSAIFTVRIQFQLFVNSECWSRWIFAIVNAIQMEGL